MSASITACRFCNSTDLIEVLCEHGPHHSRISCRACGRHQGWGAAPMTPGRAAGFVMPFGKHRGETLAQIADDPEGRRYLRWMLDNADLKPTVARAIEAHLGVLGAAGGRPAGGPATAGDTPKGAARP